MQRIGTVLVHLPDGHSTRTLLMHSLARSVYASLPNGMNVLVFRNGNLFCDSGGFTYRWSDIQLDKNWILLDYGALIHARHVVLDTAKRLLGEEDE